MKMTPMIYVSQQHCEGSHGSGWQLALESTGLPPARAWVESLPDSVFATSNLTLLLSDTWLNPLRVKLEEKVKPSELSQFLLWKLKRYLPWPVDQVCLRHLPLAEDLAWLTFSLPKPWIDTVFQVFKEKGIACGYIGGAFSSVLENQTHLRNHVNLCFFDDYYLLAELDGNGTYVRFAMRRLPFIDQAGQHLDLETLHQQDLGAIETGENRPLQVFNFAPTLDESILKLVERLDRAELSLVLPKLEGACLHRIQQCLSGGAWK